jgi:hypothetical protein
MNVAGSVSLTEDERRHDRGEDAGQGDSGDKEPGSHRF